MSTEISVALSFVEGGAQFVVEEQHRIFGLSCKKCGSYKLTPFQGESSDSAESDSADVDRRRKHPNRK